MEKISKTKNIIISIVFVTLVIISTVAITFLGREIHESYALGLNINSVVVTNGADIISIKATRGNASISGYYISTTNNVKNATFYATSSNELKVSLLNGTYYIWVKDVTGNTVRYSKTVTINRSCSSGYLANAKGSGTIKHCYYTSDGKYLEETRSEQLVTCANGYVRNEAKTQVTEDNCSGLNSLIIKNMGVNKKVCSKIWSYSCEPTASASANSNNLSVVSAITSNDWSNGNKEIVVTSKKGSSNIAGYYISTNSSKPNNSSNWNASSSTTWKTSQGAGTYYIWVKDASGNISNNYKSVTVSKIETTLPHIDSVIPSSINKTLTINASDEGGSGVAGYYISNDNNAPTLSSSWNNSTSNSFIIKKEPGTYHVWVKDAAGNISSSKTATIAKASTTDNNSLSALTIKDIDLSPAFDPATTDYSAISQVSKIVVDATLQDSNASFVKNYGPRTVKLKNGENNVVIKVKSALGDVKEYKIKVSYNGKDSAQNTTARLKSLTLNSGNLTFDPDITEYRMYVPKSLEKLEINAIAEDPTASINIENPDSLQIGDNKVVITVTATDGTSKIYNLNIIKKETEEISTNNYLKSLTITGYDIDFVRENQNYEIKLGNKTYLNVNAVAEDANAEVTIDNTKYLTKDSIINIMVRAEDGSARIYKISLNKRSLTIIHVILIIIGILIILLVIAYIILRLLGYSIYINFGVIKDFFVNLSKKNKD